MAIIMSGVFFREKASRFVNGVEVRPELRLSSETQQNDRYGDTYHLL
jgi:hypothetical protein